MDGFDKKLADAKKKIASASFFVYNEEDAAFCCVGGAYLLWFTLKRTAAENDGFHWRVAGASTFTR